MAWVENAATDSGSATDAPTAPLGTHSTHPTKTAAPEPNGSVIAYRSPRHLQPRHPVVEQSLVAGLQNGGTRPRTHKPTGDHLGGIVALRRGANKRIFGVVTLRGATVRPVCSQNHDITPTAINHCGGRLAGQDTCGRYWDRTSDLSGVNGALSR